MNHKPDSNRDRLDQILDASLASYNGAAEPRAGLEDRILANLRSQPLEQPSRWFNWQWLTASAGAVAAVVLIAVLVMPSAQHQPPPTITSNNKNSATHAMESKSPQSSTPSVVASLRNPTLRGKAAKGWGTPSLVAKHRPPAARDNASAPNQQLAVAAEVPHLEVFPAPAPLSAQERMLFSYVRRTPREVLVAVSEEQQLHEQEWMQGAQALQPAQRSEQKSENLK